MNAAHTILPVSHERDTTEIFYHSSSILEMYDVSENTSEYAMSEDDPNVAILGSTIALHNAHSALQIPAEMIMLTDFYTMLNLRGVPLQLIELLSRWAWNNRKLLNNMSLPPMNQLQELYAITFMTTGPDDSSLDFCYCIE